MFGGCQRPTLCVFKLAKIAEMKQTGLLHSVILAGRSVCATVARVEGATTTSDFCVCLFCSLV